MKITVELSTPEEIERFGRFLTHHATEQALPEEPIPGLTLADLDFSVRTFNRIKQLGIESIDALLSLTPEELFGKKHYSERALRNLNAELAKHGLKPIGAH